MAEQYGVTLFSTDFDTYSEQKKRNISLEMAARDLRYQWFAQIGKDWDFIVTAHHANDAAETLLLNLTRGTGLKGLTSIPEKNGKIIRPLLPFSATEIEDYAKTNHIAYRTDNSNFDLQFQRNRIRHNIIPQLEALNPQLINTFTQNIAHFRQSWQFYQNQIQHVVNELITINHNETVIHIPPLLAHPDGQLLLFEILNPYGFNGAQVAQIFESLSGESGKLFYSQTHSVIKNRNSLILRFLEDTKRTDAPIYFNNEDNMRDFGFKVTKMPYTTDFQFNKNPNILYMDADKVQFPLALRSWQHGDWFRPFGMKGSKKVSDFFIDAKIDIQKKRTVKLLCQEETIMWIVGERADDRFRVTENTQTVLVIEQYNIS
jgi:tRNA(Ile)-lysidine synthase